MAIFFPRSPELRSTCLASVNHFDLPNQTPLTALRLLGQHFGNDEDTINSLIKIKSLHPNSEVDFPPLRRLLVACCYGWPNHPVLQEWLNKPDSEWAGKPFYLVLHLCRIANEPERMLKYIKHAIEVFSKSLSRHDSEVARAVRMWVAEGDNRMKLTSWLDHESPSLVASAIGLITSSGRIDTHIKEKLETLFEKEVTCKDRPPRVGFDISTGQLRPIPEIIYSALIQSS